MTYRIVIMLCMAASLCGCSRKSYVALESTHRDSVSLHESLQLERLSIAVRELQTLCVSSSQSSQYDSIVITLDHLGNIVSRDAFHTTTRSTDRQRHTSEMSALCDSTTLAATTSSIATSVDSTQVPVPIEKPLTRWQRLKNDIKGYLCALALLLLVWVFRKPIKRYLHVM